MRRKKEKLAFILVAAIFSVSVFMISVIAGSKMSAKLSGAFNYDVPSEDFFLEIYVAVDGSKDPISRELIFDNFNKTDKVWSPKLQFKENDKGEIEDITFQFEIINLNESKIRVSYIIGDVDSTIELTALSSNEEPFNNSELSPLDSYENPDQTSNKTNFKVVLSAKDKEPSNNVKDSKFNFQLIFDFV